MPKSKKLKLNENGHGIPGELPKMKILTGIFAALLLLLALPTVLGQVENASAGATASEEVKAGITPDSPLYFFDTAFSRLSLALTFNKAAKAEKGLKIAQERLLEVQAMAEKGKPDKAAKAEKEYEAALATATKAADEIESGGNSESARNALEKISQLQNQTESHYDKITEVKDAILQRQKTRMSAEQIAQLQQVFGRIEEKAKEMETKLDAKRDKVATKQKAIANLTSGQVEAINAGINEKTGLAKGRQERAQKQIDRAKASLVAAKEKTEAAEAEGANVTQVREMLHEAEAKVEDIKASRPQKNKTAQYRAQDIAEAGEEISALATTLDGDEKTGNRGNKSGQNKEETKQRRIDSHENVPEKVSIVKAVTAAENSESEEDRDG